MKTNEMHEKQVKNCIYLKLFRLISYVDPVPKDTNRSENHAYNDEKVDDPTVFEHNKYITITIKGQMIDTKVFWYNMV